MSFNNLKTRLNFLGGSSQRDRMNKGKLESLKKALLYSYQAATIILSDGREFRCLINPNKLNVDLDNKILSIPFEDVCLNEDGSNEVQTNIKEGDIIEWKENGSHWMVYLQRLEETAYFRADLRRCRHQIEFGNGSKYWVYVKGPSESKIEWFSGGGNYINKLNNTLQIYVANNAETLKFFHRFAKIKLNNNTWEVQAIDSISTPGIIEVALKEYFNNTPQDNINKAVEDSINIIKIDEKEEEYIHGPIEVYPYEEYTYELKNSSLQNGQWLLSHMLRPNIAKIISADGLKVTIKILTGKSAEMQLDFVSLEKTISLPIEIQSL